MEWFYAKHGKQEGPVDTVALQAKVRSGEVAPTDLVWKEGMASWTAAGDVFELAAAPAAPVAPAPSPVAPGPSVPSAGGPAPAPGPVAGQPAPIAHAPIANFLVPSILVTVLCCVPCGIPAIVFAAKVDRLVSSGDIEGAVNASSQAKMWCVISFILGVIFYIVIFGVLLVAGIQS